jgi:hypothetical protein
MPTLLDGEQGEHAWPWRAASLLACLLLAAHYLLIGLHLLPRNYLSLTWGTSIQHYVGPVFSQVWTLFAPTPPDANQMLLVQARWRNAPDAPVQVSEWIDVTTPSIEVMQRQRLSALSRLVRPQTGLLESAFYEDPTLEELRRKSRSDRGDSSSATATPDALLTEEERAQRERGREAMYRIGSAYARRVFGPQVDSVNLRVATHRFPRFSQRHLPDSVGAVTYIELGWSAARAGVTLP